MLCRGSLCAPEIYFTLGVNQFHSVDFVSSSFGWNFSDKLLMQYRSPVGGGPSGNT